MLTVTFYQFDNLLTNRNKMLCTTEDLPVTIVNVRFMFLNNTKFIAACMFCIFKFSSTYQHDQGHGSFISE